MDNPQAFPQPIATALDGSMYCSSERHLDFAGMTLRDYFAAAALQGMLAYYNKDSGDFHTNSSFEKNAEYAYQQADAMLAQRAKD